jgi:hypothetical protein
MLSRVTLRGSIFYFDLFINYWHPIFGRDMIADHTE